MPSVVLGQDPKSGAQLVVSGPLFSSGQTLRAGMQLRWVVPLASGFGTSGLNAYIALSGGGPPLSGPFMTINSGAMQLSGGASSGMLDGMPMFPGDRYFIPPAELGNQAGVNSGFFNIFALHDQAASGIGRLYFEPFLGFRG